MNKNKVCPKTFSGKHCLIDGVWHEKYSYYDPFIDQQYVIPAYYEESKCKYCGIIDDISKKPDR